ncbi:hypothetical protein ACH4U5_26575 [Streptomyces sp. NPDC020858]|uniref:hypothetical protein n=1 Tax=Streptomyces sp. NPDC020858 TaxID=3365097 RepID=UPI00378C4075
MSIDSARVCTEPSRDREGRGGSRPRTPAARRTHTAAYALVGLAMAAVWVLGSDMPPAEHALRLLVLVLGVSAVGRLVGRRLARTGRTPVDRGLFFGLLAAKVFLVGVALLVDEIAGLWFSEPSLITAACLFVIVTTGGPALHDRLSHGTAGRGGQAPRREDAAGPAATPGAR